MFRFRRQLRRWSGWVLLLWFFGIGSGLANACLAGNAAGFGAQAELSHAAALPTEPHPAAAPIVAHHPAPAVQHPHGAGDVPAALKTNCQDFCDKSTISIPPLKMALDHADAGAAHPPPVAVLCVVAVCGPVQPWVPRLEAGVAQPITIAFLRLAL